MIEDVVVDQAETAAAILQNPFHVLGVSPRDGRERIVEAAEDRGLLMDPEICSKARSDLTNPRNRLAVEISWLPGVAPRRAETLINLAKPENIFDLERLPPLAHANLMASTFSRMDQSRADWAKNFLLFSRVVEAIDAEAVRSAINEDREIAGFPLIKAVEPVADALAEKRREFVATVRKALQEMPSRKLLDVMVNVADGNTCGGTRHPDLLVDELANAYEIGVQSFLTREAANFDALVERIEGVASAGESAVTSYVTRLEKVACNWAAVAKPLILVASAKGVRHELTDQMAVRLRGLSLLLYNKHDLLVPAQQISRLGLLLFSSLPGLGDRFKEDVSALDELEGKKSRADTVNPLYELCSSVINQSTEKPKTAVDKGRSVLGAFPDVLNRLKRAGAPQSEQNEICDAVAKTLIHCAVEQCGSMSRLDEAVKLLEEASKIAKSSDVAARVAENLKAARKNLRLYGNLEPISSAPSLSSINGFGFTVYGSSDPDAESGSYMTTYYFIALFFPIFPICRYRVIPSGKGYRFLGKAPLRTFDKWHIAASLLLILFVIMAK